MYLPIRSIKSCCLIRRIRTYGQKKWFLFLDTPMIIYASICPHYSWLNFALSFYLIYHENAKTDNHSKFILQAPTIHNLLYQRQFEVTNTIKIMWLETKLSSLIQFTEIEMKFFVIIYLSSISYLNDAINQLFRILKLCLFSPPFQQYFFVPLSVVKAMYIKNKGSILCTIM